MYLYRFIGDFDRKYYKHLIESFLSTTEIKQKILEKVYMAVNIRLKLWWAHKRRIKCLPADRDLEVFGQILSKREVRQGSSSGILNSAYKVLLGVLYETLKALKQFLSKWLYHFCLQSARCKYSLCVKIQKFLDHLYSEYLRCAFAIKTLQICYCIKH